MLLFLLRNEIGIWARVSLFTARCCSTWHVLHTASASLCHTDTPEMTNRRSLNDLCATFKRNLRHDNITNSELPEVLNQRTTNVTLRHTTLVSTVATRAYLWLYSFVTSALDGNRQIQGSGHFLCRKINPVPIKQESGWTANPVWTFWRTDEFVCPVGIQQALTSSPWLIH